MIFCLQKRGEEIMKKLVVVILEDEEDIRDLLTITLSKNNFVPKPFANANALFAYLEDNTPDLILLDLMLPDIDGLEVCRRIRKDKSVSNLPIIMLTAKSEEIDKVLGLEIGADDYITKPFSPRELIARIKALLRRSRTNQNKEEELIFIGNHLVINLHKFKATYDEEEINLTTTEFKILALFAKKRGWVFSRNKILDYLYGNEKMVIDRTVDVHIRNLRKKLKSAGEYIKNIRGIGYKLEE